MTKDQTVDAIAKIQGQEPPFVGVVTYNPLSSLRFEIFEKCIRSIEVAFPASELFLLDNGSTDGSQQMVQDILSLCFSQHVGGCSEGCEQYGRWHVKWRAADEAPFAGNTTPGAGRYYLWNHMFGHVYASSVEKRSPFWVMSDDDMLWRGGSETRLRSFWGGLSPLSRLVIVSGLLEPLYRWNTPRERLEAGGEAVLVRDSAPGAAWTFRNPRVIPSIQLPESGRFHAFGYDYESCKALFEDGCKVAQMDLADHLGWGYSTHGNDAINQSDVRPLDREKWGI